MFLLNRNNITSIDNDLSIDGVNFFASGLTKQEIERRNIPNCDVVIFDPQLYFPASLKDNCTCLFTKLSTYPWFNSDTIDFNSSEIGIRAFVKSLKESDRYLSSSVPSTEEEIKSAITSCINFQNTFNVDYLIIPMPLINDYDDCFSEQLTWIDIALEIIKDEEKPKLLSVSISENLLNNKPLNNNSNLQIIIDNLSTFDELDGFYITVERTSSGQISDPNTVNALLYLSYILGYKMKKKVIFNAVDNLGFLCMAVGATGFASGYTNKERKLDFSDFEDGGSFGKQYPKFYSYSLIGDLYSERDILKLKESKLLYFLENDKTQYSEPLFYALENNIDISRTDWKETQNNVTLAKNHRYQLLANKCREINSLTINERIDYTLKWLQTAEINSSYLKSRFSHSPFSEDFKHIPVWRICFEKFINYMTLE